MNASLKFLKSSFIFFAVFPFFLLSMDQPYPQLQLQCKQPEKIYPGTLQIASLPFYCSNPTGHQNPNAELYRFNLAENNPIIICHLIPTDTSEYKSLTIMIAAQHLFNCNDGSSLQLSFPIIENDETKLIHFNAQCKKNDEPGLGSDFVTQFTDFMSFFYEEGAGTTRMLLPRTIEALISNEIIKKEQQSQDRILIVAQEDGTTQRIVAPLYKLVHGTKGCASENDFKYIMMEKKTQPYPSKNILNYIINREIGR